MSDPLIIAGQEFGSRLFLGTPGYPNRKIMLDAIEASGTAMVTASIRRISLAGDDESLIDLLGNRVRFLPNTAGCQTAKDAVLTAELAREALETNWVKLEVIGDEKTLYPDNVALLEATRVLVGEGFVVLPYTNDDPVICRKLEEAGAGPEDPGEVEIEALLSQLQTDREEAREARAEAERLRQQARGQRARLNAEIEALGWPRARERPRKRG